MTAAEFFTKTKGWRKGDPCMFNHRCDWLDGVVVKVNRSTIVVEWRKTPLFGDEDRGQRKVALEAIRHV